jgi:hypothetical protein
LRKQAGLARDISHAKVNGTAFAHLDQPGALRSRSVFDRDTGVERQAAFEREY